MTAQQNSWLIGLNRISVEESDIGVYFYKLMDIDKNISTGKLIKH